MASSLILGRIGIADGSEGKSVNCLAALSKCTNLRHLDLSLISESLPLRDFLHAIAPLKNLTSLRFPRSSSSHTSELTRSQPHSWPPNLENLHLSGRIHDTSISLIISSLPTTLTHLTIEHCPTLSRLFIWQILPTLAEGLTHLRISYQMPRLYRGSLDEILFHLPNLRVFSIAADYISRRFFTEYRTNEGEFLFSHPLEMLELEDSGATDLPLEEYKIKASAVSLAVLEGRLGRLRRVRAHERLGWLATAQDREEVEDLVELLEDKAREDAESGALGAGMVAPASEAGVWVFE